MTTTGGTSGTGATPATVGHVHHDPQTAPASPDAAWLAWSKAWTRQVATLTGRSDLTVTVAPGAGRGAPACHIPALATIEVDAALIGNPTMVDPRRPGHKKHVPAAYGALVHEAAHAVHSTWCPPQGTPLINEIAMLLEESRIEAAHRRRRPRDRQWLRHAVRTIINPGQLSTDHPWHAAYAAGLLLARVDARILTHADTRTLRTTIRSILGHKLLQQLRRIWREAHTVPDTDHDHMLHLAHLWCRALGINPADGPTDLSTQPAGRRLPQAVAATIAATDPHHRPPTTPHPQSTRQAARAASPGTGGNTPANWTSRPPAGAERATATRLAAAIRAARSREPVPVRAPATAPPGRLQTRAAISAEAQTATGALVTAQPWQRRTHLRAPDPELSIAVLVDVSGSMHQFTGPMSATAWILAHAAARTHAHAATIAFGDRVTTLVGPRQQPTHVKEMQADSNQHRFTEAAELADHLLGLSTPGRVRLLAVVSDGKFFEHIPAAQHTITQLAQSGCAVLWLQPATQRCHTFANTTVVTVDDPTTCTRIITQAATNALANA